MQNTVKSTDCIDRINAKNTWRFMKGDGLNDQTGLYLWTWRSR